MTEQPTRKIAEAKRAIATVAIKVAMALLWPVRLTGIFGTASHPIYRKRGEPVPFHLLGKYPLDLKIMFVGEATSWFEYSSGLMILQLLEPGTVIIVHNAGIPCSMQCGAPTEIRDFDGTPIALPADTELAEAGA